jgi:hypothetical protein
MISIANRVRLVTDHVFNGIPLDIVGDSEGTVTTVTIGCVERDITRPRYFFTVTFDISVQIERLTEDQLELV